MKAFLQGFNLVRTMIVLFLIGSVPMALEVWKREQNIQQLATATGFDRNFEPSGIEDSPMVLKIKDIIKLAKQHTNLQKSLESEGIKGNDTPLSYIRDIAKDAYINLGGVEIKTSKKEPVKGMVDNIYKITPQKKQGKENLFSRVTISNFLYKLEHDSRRVRVTNFSIEARRTTPVAALASKRCRPTTGSSTARSTMRVKK